MPVLNMPEPERWGHGRRKLLFALVFAAVALGFLLFEGAQATLRGHYLTTVVVAGWAAPFICGFIALALASLLEKRIRATVDLTGTTFWPDKRLGVVLFIGILLFVPAGVLYVIFVPRGQIDLAMTRGFQIFSPILMAAGLMTIVGGLIRICRRRVYGFIRLGPSGVESADVYRTIFVAWNDIEDITDVADKLSRKPALLVCSSGERKVVNGLTAYVPGGGLYWMIRHYWQHPDDRAELVDWRGLERLREGRFDVDQAPV